MEMASREIELMREKLASFEKAARRKRVRLKAELEEIELRMREIEETKQNFETEVVIEGSEPITGKIPAERVIRSLKIIPNVPLRFVEEWLRTMDTAMEKLRLKSATVKSQINKAKQQLLQREELGEALHAVDFEQLDIENRDFIRKIDEKNQHVLEMKRIAGRYSLELTRRKETLGELFLALNTVKREIIMKQQQIERLQSEHANTNFEIGKVKEQLASLLKLMDEYWVPQILDFVKLQANVQELQRTHKGLIRQKKIQQLTAKSNKNSATKKIP
ncbi:hypothetical protein KM043_008389 [Ampulex compressa]|nr:hypothetical protein KM043_008389 [Ampulex compressa]